MGITLLLVYFMHRYSAESGGAYVYGWLAASISIILGIVIASPQFAVFKDITFFFDVDYYLSFICFAIALWTIVVGYNLYRIEKPKDYY